MWGIDTLASVYVHRQSIRPPARKPWRECEDLSPPVLPPAVGPVNTIRRTAERSLLGDRRTVWNSISPVFSDCLFGSRIPTENTVDAESQIFVELINWRARTEFREWNAVFRVTTCGKYWNRSSAEVYSCLSEILDILTKQLHHAFVVSLAEGCCLCQWVVFWDRVQ